MRKGICFLISFLFCMGLIAHSAFAVEVVRIDKSKIRLNIAPGKTKVGVINIENPSDETKTVKMYLEDWYYLPPFDGSKEFKPAGTTPLSCSQWITFSPSQVVLGPYGKQSINYTIKVPESAQGGAYAVLFFESILGTPDSQGVGVSVAVRIASLFYIEAGQTLKKDVSWKNFNVEKSTKDSPMKISLAMKNEGNVDITASGNFNLMDKKGKVYARGDLNSIYTFPQDESNLSATWSLPIPDGLYDLILTLDLGKAQEEAGMGRGPVVVKESQIEIASGAVVKVGDLK